MTKKQIMERLDRAGIAYSSKATKAELRALLPTEAPKSPLIVVWVPDWLLDSRTKRLPPGVGPGTVIRLKRPTSAPPGGGRWVKAPPPLWLVADLVVRGIRLARAWL